jgi:hypothetical protein
MINLLFQHHGRSVRHDLAHCLTDLRRIESHHDNGIGVHETRVADHPVDSMTPGLLEQLCVLGNFATDDRAQSSHDIPAKPAAPHYQTEDLTLDLDHAMSGHIFCCHNKHNTSANVAIGAERLPEPAFPGDGQVHEFGAQRCTNGA